MKSTDFLQAPPLYRQIVARFENDIYAGRLRGGARIPSTTELAKEFGIGRNTVQQALSILAERGLLERRSKRGTFVSDRVHVKTLGAIFGRDIVSDQYSQFYRLVYGELARQSRDFGWRTVLYFPVIGESFSRYISKIEADIVGGEVGAIVNFDDSDLTSECLRSAGCVSIDFFMSLGKANDNRNNVLYRGLSYLLDRGYRDIVVVQSTERDKNLSLALPFDERGINKRAKTVACGDITERGGVSVAEKIFSVGNRPEALLVLNDTICRGVIFHLMEQGISIPKDIAIMAMTNKGHEVLSTTPLTRLEWDPEGLVAANLARLFAKIAGTPWSGTAPEPKLIIGESCGELCGA